MADEVAYSVRVMEIQEYGKDRLPAGPAIDESDEIIIVEGRADVLNLLKHGFKNAIALNGTSVPETAVELCAKKVVTIFVDGDRGGNLIVKELTSLADVDFVARAPDGKEVEEITQKEIHKALRGRISGEQAKLEFSKETEKYNSNIRPLQKTMDRRPQQFRPIPPRQPMFSRRPIVISPENKKVFRDMLENLVGTRGAQVLDQQLNTLGKVPVTELESAIKSLNNTAYAIVFDGSVDSNIAKAAESANVKFLVGMDSKIRPNDTRVNVLTVSEL